MTIDPDAPVPLVLVPPVDTLTPMGIVEGIGRFGRAANHSRGPTYRVARWFFWICIALPYLLFVAIGLVAVVASVITLAFG